MKSAAFLLFSLLLFSASSLAQGKQGQELLDSLVAEVPRIKEDTAGVRFLSFIATQYAHTDPVKGMAWAKKEIALARKIGWRLGEAYAYNDFGNNLQNQGLYASALDTFFKALRIFEEIGNKYHQSVVSLNIGLLYQRQKEYSKALQWDFKALKIGEEIADMDIIGTVQANIGIVYQMQKENKAALEWQLKSLHTAEKRGVKDIMSQLNSISGTYQNMKQYAPALAYAFKSLRNAEEMGNKMGIAANLGNAGEMYYALATDSAAPTPDSLIPVSRTENLKKAVDYLRRGIAACREINLLEGIAEFAPYLSNALAARGDHQGALAAYKEYVSAKDSLFNTANTEAIATLETQRALQLKDKDIRIAELEVAKKRNERGFFIAGIALLLIIFGIIVYNFRRHANARQRIKELQDHKILQLDDAVKRRTEQLSSMRQTIATDFHDQTGNMLAAIARQAATLEIKLLHQPEYLTAVRSIITNSNELYASSKDFLWNLNHESDDPLVLLQYLSGYGQRFYNQFDISFSSSVIGEPQSHLQLHPLAGLNLIYIFKEGMSNVVKHSGADEVSMEMHWEDARVVYSLHDNGIWKEADPSVEHYGLSNMERRCQQSGFSYDLKHGESGTHIAIGLPLNAYRTQSLTT